MFDDCYHFIPTFEIIYFDQYYNYTFRNVVFKFSVLYNEIKVKDAFYCCLRVLGFFNLFVLKTVSKIDGGYDPSVVVSGLGMERVRRWLGLGERTPAAAAGRAALGAALCRRAGAPYSPPAFYTHVTNFPDFLRGKC